MESFYQEKFRLRISDFSMHDELLPQAILDLFQDVAGKHADNLKIGFNDLIHRDLIWVLLRSKFEIVKNPKLYSTVIVKTWPKQKGKIDFDREYLITDENGDVLVKGISKWVIVNFKTRRMSFTRDINYDCEILNDENFIGAFPKIEDFDITNLDFYQDKTSFCDLDHNGHVNNAKYAKYVLNTIKLDKNEKIKSFQLDHIKELSPDIVIKNYYKRENKNIYVKGITEDNIVSYICKIELR